MPQDSLPESDHVNMLIDLLLRFPEIYTISLNLPSSTCYLSYMIGRKLNRGEGPALQRHLQENLETFYFLNRCEGEHRLEIEQSGYGNLTRLQLTLGYDHLLGGVISLLTAVVSDLFRTDLIIENRAGENLPRLEIDPAGELSIPNGPDIRSNHLFAFRDSGKVYIFDK